ncbi:S41 family peptidase [Maribellus maritimus]|uniref:S41 family peptidase n=1 Tax=Maribellus maritimus TaxID=2870838 RepID=UPI001EEC7D87|nr:S41 family peptidase [Maribellus maritimus]MCG6189301.1 PDZ domain-containing protein [Maribellus maritimus]
MKNLYLTALFVVGIVAITVAQGTKLLRQPALSKTHVAFTYGSDIWVTDLETNQTKRLTNTGAVESNPHFSPDGKTIAFSSNRSGVSAVYTVPVEGGMPQRLTWYPSSATVCDWTPDGKYILYSTSRETAPTGYDRLWTVSKDGGPSELLTEQWGADGSFSPDGKQIVIDRVSRWDGEWRNYRGGQNTPLVILNINDMSEELLPNERTIDIKPVWLGEQIYFLSDRDWISNIWSYSPKTKELKQITHFSETDVKWVAGKGNQLVFEHKGLLNLLNLTNNEITQLNITIAGDFPWADEKWEDVSNSVRSASLSPTGKRAIMESRGEIFTIPVENGNVRNLTNSSDVADRTPVWSPRGDKIAWFSDKGGNYSLLIGNQDGLSEATSISIGESNLGWEPTWSPDGKYIAFDDDDVRIRVIEVESGNIQTIDLAGNNQERGSLGLTWSPDSKWLAYSKSGDNNFRRIKLWSVENKSITTITDELADAFSPAFDCDKKHLYFLASTELALGSGWANTSAMTANPEYAAYVVNLQKDEASPFKLKSDEEEVKEDKENDGDKKDNKKEDKKSEEKKKDEEKDDSIKIDFEGIDRRIIALPIPVRNYQYVLAGPEGTVFIGERISNSPGLTLQKFSLEDQKATPFVEGVGSVSLSADSKKILGRVGGSWKVMDATKPNGKDGENLKVELKMKLNRSQEWNQMFEEAWRYEKDYFYAPNMHGRDWEQVHARYAPLIPHIKHRADLTYILDQVNGELSVGHSFVFGGDYPDTERNSVGLLGADFIPEKGYWKIKRIYTTESWNPNLSSPLEEPGLKVKAGNYIVGVNGEELTTEEDLYQYLDGTAGVQTVLQVNDKPDFKDSWTITVKPIRSESGLRQRAWVEDNRRLVDSLSNGRLAYVWVPNTSSNGFVSFNRYFFAQQDKEGAVIDERFNGGGLLDDYMVDLMTRKLRAAVTNEVKDGKPWILPAGILGPKVLLINELAGSGGDFFPWVFRHQNAGPLIGTRTWGGLVASAVHYSLVDGGALTAPTNAVYDPVKKEWIAENKGVAPDIEVRQDAKSLAKGIDPQLVRAVEEALKLVKNEGKKDDSHPPYSTPALKK